MVFNNAIIKDMKKKIAIVGFGGRTGTMFAFELGEQNEVLGVSKKATLEFLKENKLYVKRDGSRFPVEGRVVTDTKFSEENRPDIMFLAIGNPISETLKYYYQKCGSEKPIFVLSQNGINAIDSAKKALGENANIVRMVLFNAISRERNTVKYSSPIKVALAQALGNKGVDEVAEILKNSDFKVDQFPKKEAKNIEFSKLFLNLIGMASASKGLSIREGFTSKEIFREEIKALKEYVEIVRSAGGKFVNFSNYPIKLFVFLVSLPVSLLIPFREKLAGIITKGRGDKPKDLREIDYYNGAVVDLANQLKTEKKGKAEDYSGREKTDITRDFNPRVAINQKIYWRAAKRIREA